VNDRQKLVFEVESLSRLLEVLQAEGYLVVGPTVWDNTIVYDRLESADQLTLAGGTSRMVASTDWRNPTTPPGLAMP
jgi:hypothetical protein